ncbi:hypothetical protein [Deinococcus maricopensis]|uniref:hypothetical protein n=1 Tax=Deinococcus maricopensis TaxID=309887 RepID=UPI0011D24550|nr:hypothetical protein [Deinococcus maricopensis]
MDNQLEKNYQEALHKTLDALLVATSTLALMNGNATLKSSSTQNFSNAVPSATPTPGATYKKRTQLFLDTGEERTVVATYKLNLNNQWELMDVRIEDAPAA